MRRVLSAEERALWRRVTADVRGKVVVEADPVPAVPANALPPRQTPIVVAKVVAKPAPALQRHQLPRTAAHRATLDGKWDRDLKTGKVSPDRVIDLHECTLAQAHDRALAGLDAAIAMGERLVVMVTGKAPGPGRSRLDSPLRGIIRASITDWLHGAPFASRIAAIRPAHARHGGAGALYVVLRRSDRR
jgi:DNA-nicking Smr family endonuclease